MSRWLNATMTKVEYASLCSKETKTVQYGGIEVKGKYKVRKRNDDEFQEVHAAIAVTTFLSYYIMIIIGHIRDFLRKILKRDKSAVKDDVFKLESDFSHFYTRNLYTRIQDCWNRPIASAPGPYMDVIDRYSDDYNLTFKCPGTTSKVLNLGSYNYLGFAESGGPCMEGVVQRIKNDGVSSCSSRKDLGSTTVLKELEALTARFVGKESAMVFGMGFATNSGNIPSLMGEGCLILSDACNHISVVLGARLSGAAIQKFKHNDIDDLEKKLRKAIIEGNPRTHRPWKKIFLLVEGIYSMEGTILKLPEIIRLKKKYKAYLYIDEAHSIGALGPTGRGVCEYYGVDPSEVDILMGTFTKSFGSSGGYVAASHKIINFLRQASYGATYATSMSPPVAQMAISAMKIVMGENGTNEGKMRIDALAENTGYFRRRLKEMGFVLYGNDHSPVIPLLLYGKMPAFSRECLRRNLGVVVVGYPATPIIEGRSRICISAAHTREMLDWQLTTKQ
ncbi:serine palmitoyltransferase 2-like isoform X2 [Dysidea avara]|uniref:serine palmitoyltransferase 2-like isoform X2 n=1 Tax=Dysidea avara TaxID=196820 RepID=UPI00332B1357